jgi:hypothetical protein
MTIEMIDQPESEIAEYIPFYAELAKLEEENKTLVFDYASKKGDKDARSHIHKLRLSKGNLERARVAAKAEALRIGRLVDSEAKAISSRVDAMIDVHQNVLDEIERKEKERVSDLRGRLTAVSMQISGPEYSADFYRMKIEEVESVVIDDSWQEFKADAALAKDGSLTFYKRMLAARIQLDADAEELKRLRELTANQAPATTSETERITPIKEAVGTPIPYSPIVVAATATDTERARKAVINAKARDCLMQAGLTKELATGCIIMIVNGMVPNVSISYKEDLNVG